MASIKKKRVSKKKKIAWRKHVDINDVEDFLEDKRLEERLGQKIDTLEDKDIFQIDTKPRIPKKLSRKDRKKLSIQTPPKCFSLLQPLTKVPDPIKKRNRVRTREERKHPIAKRNEEKRKLNGIVKSKEKVRELNRLHEKLRKAANKYVQGEIKSDLWEVEDCNEINLPVTEWINNDTLRHTRQGLGKLKKMTPKSVHKKTSVIKAVEIPHPGMSYNPSLKDHQALLQEIAQDEIKLIKEEKHIERVTTKMFKKVSPEKKETAWLVEMSEGLPNPEQKDEKVNENEEYKAINPPAQNKKKDPKQRRKQKEQRILEKQRNDEKIEKKKISDLYKIKKLNKSIEKQQRKAQLLKEKREKKKKYEILEPKTLSRNKFIKPDLEFHLGNEISGDLRNLKKQGNLLRDRFKSLQKRNILEPTVKQPPKKKPKYKKYERPSHKMGWEPKGY